MREKGAAGAEALVVSRRMGANDRERVGDLHRDAEVFAGELDRREDRQIRVALATTGAADRADFA